MMSVLLLLLSVTLNFILATIDKIGLSQIYF